MNDNLPVMSLPESWLSKIVSQKYISLLFSMYVMVMMNDDEWWVMNDGDDEW